MATNAHGPTQLGVQRLDGVGGVDDSAHSLREGEERNDVLPLPPPDLSDRLVFSSPGARVKGFQGLSAGLGILGAVDFSQLGDDRLPVLPGDEIERVSNEMHDAGLHRSFREDGVDRLGKAFEAVDDGDQDVLDAAGLQFVHNPQPELRALGVFDPEPEDVLGAFGRDAERDVDGLVANQALVADLDAQGVEKHQGIARLQWPVLPFRDRLQNRVGDRRNQVRRHFEAVELQQMALDLAHRHAARIHRHDPVVEAGKPPLVALDQLRIEGSFSIARNADVDLRRLGQNRLLRIAVAVVLAARRRPILQMIVKLGAQNPLGQSLLQLVKQAVFRKHRLRVSPIQKLIQGVLLDRHTRPPSARLWPPTQNS